MPPSAYGRGRFSVRAACSLSRELPSSLVGASSSLAEAPTIFVRVQFALASSLAGACRSLAPAFPFQASPQPYK